MELWHNCHTDRQLLLRKVLLKWAIQRKREKQFLLQTVVLLLLSSLSRAWNINISHPTLLLFQMVILISTFLESLSICRLAWKPARLWWYCPCNLQTVSARQPTMPDMYTEVALLYFRPWKSLPVSARRPQSFLPDPARKNIVKIQNIWTLL